MEFKQKHAFGELMLFPLFVQGNIGLQTNDNNKKYIIPLLIFFITNVSSKTNTTILRCKNFPRAYFYPSISSRS
jgi:hypothetical protein